MNVLLAMAVVSMCASTVHMAAIIAHATEALFYTAIGNNAEVSKLADVSMSWR